MEVVKQNETIQGIVYAKLLGNKSSSNECVTRLNYIWKKPEEMKMWPTPEPKARVKTVSRMKPIWLVWWLKLCVRYIFFFFLSNPKIIFQVTFHVLEFAKSRENEYWWQITHMFSSVYIYTKWLRAVWSVSS